MLSREKIQELVDTDAHFVDFVRLMYETARDRREMNVVDATLRKYNITPPDAWGDVVKNCGRKAQSLSALLEDVYGLTWHNHRDAYRAACLEN